MFSSLSTSSPSPGLIPEALSPPGDVRLLLHFLLMSKHRHLPHSSYNSCHMLSRDSIKAHAKIPASRIFSKIAQGLSSARIPYRKGVVEEDAGKLRRGMRDPYGSVQCLN